MTQATPIRNKLKLWISKNRGAKSRFTSGVKKPAQERDDIPDVVVANKIKRGDLLQEARLRFYPSINVDKKRLYAGEIRGDLDDAINILNSIGYRNNPTAYVEVTEEHGPDDGSYSRQIITEDDARLDIPQFVPSPAIYKRLKRQNHITIYQVGEKIIFLAHEEISAWLQPARHVVQGDATARIGVRNFRNRYFDELGEELPGKENVLWDLDDMH